MLGGDGEELFDTLARVTDLVSYAGHTGCRSFEYSPEYRFFAAEMPVHQRVIDPCCVRYISN
jgi:hypothetical protein